MTNTRPVTVYEYLRPENTMEKVDYHLPMDCADIAERLAEHDVHPCCDIYSDGSCTVYVYENKIELPTNRLRGQMHSTADVAMTVLLRSIDFSKYS